MPTYEHECPDHGVFDDTRPMRDSGRRARCPQCRRLSPRVWRSVPQGIVEEDWSRENGGRGREINGLNYRTHPDAPLTRVYASSPTQALETAKQLGHQAEKV